MQNMLKPRWLIEVIAVWGYVQRNYFLTKRYFMWELVWLTVHHRQRHVHHLYRGGG
jgi:hypothetical protein